MQWRFLTYRRANGADDVSDWYEALSAKAQVRVARTFQRMRDTSHLEWSQVVSIKGARGLSEVKFRRLDGLEWRISGCFPSSRMSFALPLPFYHQNRRYSPAGWKDLSIDRMKEIKDEPSRAKDWPLFS